MSVYVCDQCHGTGQLPEGQRCPCREEDDTAAARRKGMALEVPASLRGANVTPLDRGYFHGVAAVPREFFREWDTPHDALIRYLDSISDQLIKSKPPDEEGKR
jgi:hypothetical protein